DVYKRQVVDSAQRAIVFLVSSDKRTGVGREALCHARLVADAGWRAIFCCQKGGSLQAAAEKAGLASAVNLALPTRSGFWRFFVDIWRLRQMARRENPAAFFVYRSNDHLAAVLACRHQEMVARFWPGAAASSSDKRGFPFLLQKRWCAAALCASPGDALALARWRGSAFPLDRGANFGDWEAGREEAQKSGVYFAPAGVDTAYFAAGCWAPAAIRRERGWGEKDTIFGLVAPLKPERGHGYFCQALAQARRQERSLRGLFIASSTRQERAWLAEVATPLRLGSEVDIIDAGEKYGEILSALDVGVVLHPGSAGTARAALEMLAMAKPAIVANQGVLAFLAASRAALAVPPPPPAKAASDAQQTSVAALAEAMLCLHRNLDWRFQLGQAGQRLAKEKFSLAALQQCLAALLGNIALR
ncbi:MAG: hypothetical protein N3A66_08495, partial [Planctomycetota bacterium]|nr:hypothetical protein [Planctomycetota bacterium]